MILVYLGHPARRCMRNELTGKMPMLQKNVHIHYILIILTFVLNNPESDAKKLTK